LGPEETSEAEDVFNEKADFTVFREKLKNSHEMNEVSQKFREIDFFVCIFAAFRLIHVSSPHHLNYALFFLRRSMTQTVAISAHRRHTPSIRITMPAPMSMKTFSNIPNYIRATRALICRKKI